MASVMVSYGLLKISNKNLNLSFHFYSLEVWTSKITSITQIVLKWINTFNQNYFASKFGKMKIQTKSFDAMTGHLSVHTLGWTRM